jgi:hypothetical protein
VTASRLVATPQADLDVAAAYQWYENEGAGLGLQFLNQLSGTYDRIAEDPLRYHDLIVVLAVLHVSRDPAEWQRRRRS